MNNTDEVLSFLEQQKEVLRSEFRDVKRDIEQAEARLQSIKGELAVLDRLVFRRHGPPQQQSPPLSGLGKYAAMGPSDAIRDIFDTHPGRWFSTNEVCETLLKEGVNTSASDFRAGVFVILGRFEKNGYLITSLRGGQRTFTLNQAKKKADATHAASA